MPGGCNGQKKSTHFLWIRGNTAPECKLIAARLTGILTIILEGGTFGMERFKYRWRSEEHTSELQSLMRISYAVFCLKKKKNMIIMFMTFLYIYYHDC